MNFIKNFIVILLIILIPVISHSQIQIPRTYVLPVIDGEMDEGIWENSFIDSIKIPIVSEAPESHSDLSVEFRMLWSASNIYLFISVTDDDISIEHTTWYENDALSIFIDGGNEKNITYDDNDIQIATICNSNQFNNPDLVPLSHVICKETDNGYNYEIRLSGSDLANSCGIELSAGTQFGIDMEMIDNDLGEGRDHVLIYWSLTPDYWNNPRRWGSAVLTERFAQIQIPKTNIAPVIDGEMDMVWQYAAIDSIKKDIEKESWDFSSEFRMFWDENNIYLFISVTDDNIYSQNANYWENDVVQFYIDGGDEKNAEYDQNDLQFSYVVNSSEFTVWNFQYNTIRFFGEEEFANCQFVSKETDRGYNYEIRLAASDLEKLEVSLASGTELGWEIVVMDNDFGNMEGGLTWWNAADDNYENPSRWGTARLTDFTPYPNNINLAHTIDFPVKPKGSDYDPTDYRIIGFPGASRIVIGELCSGTQDEDWQIYWDNGEESDFFVEYDGSDDFRCQPGRAFWILKKGDFQIDQSKILPAPLNVNGQAEIELHPRWNLITNPFPIPVSWAQVKEINQITAEFRLWSYPGSWNNENQLLEPYAGYYVDNDSSVDIPSLRIPFYIENPYLNKSGFQDEYQWQVSLSLASGEITDKCCFLAVKEGAEPGKDRNEFCRPRSPGLTPEVYFYRPGWDKDYPSFASDVRPPFQEIIEEWNFRVQIPSRTKSSLSFPGTEEIPLELSVYLIDHSDAGYINLREQDVYDFTPSKEISTFSIVVGKEYLVNERLKNVIPKDFSLSQNFPNPFNPGTTIPFALPSRSRITIKIYNIMGQKVKTLIDGTMDAGRHQVSWDGKDDRGLKVASGLYIYRMRTAGGKNFSGKMVLLK